MRPVNVPPLIKWNTSELDPLMKDDSVHWAAINANLTLDTATNIGTSVLRSIRTDSSPKTQSMHGRHSESERWDSDDEKGALLVVVKCSFGCAGSDLD